ncbi:MAG: hypothetical protein NTU88_12520 [Armatimonadetes bacterium]|nr:hypothetical protein [Armatimonadota bacterium]
MGGFGIASREDCVASLFYGTDYHSHFGTRRGGMAVAGRDGIARFIQDITNAQFRSTLEHNLQSSQHGWGSASSGTRSPSPAISAGRMAPTSQR